MTSATGDTRAFTLLEILLALALIALLATVFIGGSSALIADKPLSPDDVFWKVAQQARKTALSVDDTVTPQSVPLNGPPDLAVDFLSTQKDASLSLVGGVAIQTATLPFVTFYTDGTCSPFKVQFRSKAGAHVLAIDPWTCAPVLVPPDPAAHL